MKANPNFNKRKAISLAASMFIGVAAGTVVSMALKQNVEATKVSQKVAKAVGAFAVSWIVQDKVEETISNCCDQIFDTIDAVKALNVPETPKDITIEESSISEDDE